MGRNRRCKARGKKKRGKRDGGGEESTSSSSRKLAESLRFTIGSRVECCVDTDGTDGKWVTATVVKLLYDTEIEGVGIVPYQLQCDDGALRFAYDDTTDYVRASSSPPMPISFAPGTRVNCKCCYSMDWQMGTILSANEDWSDEIDWGTETDIMSTKAAYEIQFDDGSCQYFFGPEQWLTFVGPPMQMNFNAGARIECKMPDSNDWRLGTVAVASAEEFMYSIYFDDNDETENFFGPQAHIRKAALRFKIGDRVILKYAPDLLPGTVVKLWEGGYDYWGEGTKVPYQVRLDNGFLTYAHTDTEAIIRASDAPPLDVKYSTGARVECKHWCCNLEGCKHKGCKRKSDVWRQGTVVRSNKDWVKHDRPPYFIRFVSDDGEPQYEEFWGPNHFIRECILSTADFANLAIFDATSDDELFAPPPLPHDCPICFLPLPVECNEYANLPCCGKTICSGCNLLVQCDPDRCKRKCPFCRTSLDISEEEHVALSMKRVDLDDAEITFCMGCYYDNGHGVPKDVKRAFELWLRAAELGSARACTNVAVAYRNGSLVEHDESKERAYFEKAAKLGEARARRGLALLEERKGNAEMALRHWKIAAVQGFKHALPPLLHWYQKGMLSKEEYADILRASQKAQDAEWSKDRDFARKYC